MTFLTNSGAEAACENDCLHSLMRPLTLETDNIRLMPTSRFTSELHPRRIRPHHGGATELLELTQLRSKVFAADIRSPRRSTAFTNTCPRCEQSQPPHSQPEGSL